MHVRPLELASADAFYEKLSSGITGAIVRALARLAR
jgi:hypothetical protein